MKLTLDAGSLVETIFLKGDWLSEHQFDYLTDFCLDTKGNVRKGTGMVTMRVEDEFNPDYVPAVRWEIKQSPWNSHYQYVEIDLPNPQLDPELYKQIRQAFMAEFEKRIANLPSY